MLNTKKKKEKKAKPRNYSISLWFDQFLHKIIIQGNKREQLFVINEQSEIPYPDCTYLGEQVRADLQEQIKLHE